MSVLCWDGFVVDEEVLERREGGKSLFTVRCVFGREKCVLVDVGVCEHILLFLKEHILYIKGKKKVFVLLELKKFFILF